MNPPPAQPLLPPQIPTPTMTTTPTPGIPSPILRAAHASDQEMYPVSLSYTRLRAWVDACPNLAVCWEVAGSSPHGSGCPEDAQSAVAGVVIVLPLKRRCWEDLLVGRLKEPEIEVKGMFAGMEFGEEGVRNGDGEEEEVGLHVYHIERFGAGSLPGGGVEGEAKSGKKRFAELALEEVMRRAETRTGWKVLGMSGKLAKQLKKQGTEAVLGLADGVALTATPAGRRTFERSGFTPTGYRELFVAKDTTRVDAAQADGPQVEMICLYPGDETFSATVTERATIISMSEMTVRYKP